MTPRHRFLPARGFVGCGLLLALASSAASGAPASVPAVGSFADAALLGVETVTLPGGGEPTIAADGSTAELVRIPPRLIDRLLVTPDEQSVLVDGWPLAPGKRELVALQRFDVYAPDARILVVDNGLLLDAPRSPLVFFRGTVSGDAGTRLLVALDPTDRQLQARSWRPDGSFHLRRIGKANRYLVTTRAGAARELGGDPGDWSCGQETTPLSSLSLPLTLPGSVRSVTAAEITELHRATIAVDTDNELMQLKFGDNTTTATNYIANLIAAMNVIYERDLLVRLVQGTTFLRVSSTPDPYAQTGGSATFEQLQEFSNYWSTGCAGTCVGVSRALAMLLSGKSSNPNSASGIAWLTGLCSTTIGYSFTQVFKFAADTSSLDDQLVGHEIGHNVGSPHTHCYTPPIDNCFAIEPGCYSGPTSCPATTTINGVPNVRGTIMSYCNGIGGCSRNDVFHPTTVALLDPLIEAQVGTCLFAVNTVFRNGFETPALSAFGWHAKTP